MPKYGICNVPFFKKSIKRRRSPKLKILFQLDNQQMVCYCMFLLMFTYCLLDALPLALESVPQKHSTFHKILNCKNNLAILISYKYERDPTHSIIGLLFGQKLSNSDIIRKQLNVLIKRRKNGSTNLKHHQKGMALQFTFPQQQCRSKRQSGFESARVKIPDNKTLS